MKIGLPCPEPKMIKRGGLSLEVSFFYIPSEPPSFDSEGSDEELEIVGIKLQGIEVMQMIMDLTGDDLSSIEAEVMPKKAFSPILRRMVAEAPVWA